MLFGKYIKRIALAILIFGLPMTLAETFLQQRGLSPFIILTSIEHWMCGHSWAHMWYLYMLIGLYLTTPIIKPFLNQASNRDIRIALCAMFVASSLLPMLQHYNISIDSYIIIGTPFIFVYMMGYYLQWRIDEKELHRYTALYIAILLISLASIVLRIYYDIKIYGYIDVACISMAASIFLLFKRFNLSSGMAERLAPYCFCVYLIHPIFINAFYKILHITPLNILEGCSLAITIPLMFVLFSILSFGTAWVLLKNPFLKKYVL